MVWFTLTTLIVDTSIQQKGEAGGEKSVDSPMTGGESELWGSKRRKKRRRKKQG